MNSSKNSSNFGDKKDPAGFPGRSFFIAAIYIAARSISILAQALSSGPATVPARYS